MLQEKNFSQILSDKDDQLRGPVYNQEKKAGTQFPSHLGRLVAWI